MRSYQRSSGARDHRAIFPPVRMRTLLTTDGGSTFAGFGRAVARGHRGRRRGAATSRRSIACRASASWSTPRAAAIRAAVLAQAGAAAAFNHDVFDLKESGMGTALGTARTLPMMAKRRLVVGKAIDEVKAADSSRCWPTSRIPTPRPAWCWSPTRSTCGCKRVRGAAQARLPARVRAAARQRAGRLAAHRGAEPRHRHQARRGRGAGDAGGARPRPAGAGAGAARHLRRRRAARSASTTSRTWSPRRASTRSSS